MNMNRFNVFWFGMSSVWSAIDGAMRAGMESFDHWYLRKFRESRAAPKWATFVFYRHWQVNVAALLVLLIFPLLWILNSLGLQPEFVQMLQGADLWRYGALFSGLFLLFLWSRHQYIVDRNFQSYKEQAGQSSTLQTMYVYLTCANHYLLNQVFRGNPNRRIDSVLFAFNRTQTTDIRANLTQLGALISQLRSNERYRYWEVKKAEKEAGLNARAAATAALDMAEVARQDVIIAGLDVEVRVAEDWFKLNIGLDWQTKYSELRNGIDSAIDQIPNIISAITWYKFWWMKMLAGLFVLGFGIVM